MMLLLLHPKWRLQCESHFHCPADSFHACPADSLARKCYNISCSATTAESHQRTAVALLPMRMHVYYSAIRQLLQPHCLRLAPHATASPHAVASLASSSSAAACCTRTPTIMSSCWVRLSSPVVSCSFTGQLLSQCPMLAPCAAASHPPDQRRGPLSQTSQEGCQRAPCRGGVRDTWAQAGHSDLYTLCESLHERCCLFVWPLTCMLAIAGRHARQGVHHRLKPAHGCICMPLHCTTLRLYNTRQCMDAHMPPVWHEQCHGLGRARQAPLTSALHPAACAPCDPAAV